MFYIYKPFPEFSDRLLVGLALYCVFMIERIDRELRTGFARVEHSLDEIRSNTADFILND